MRLLVALLLAVTTLGLAACGDGDEPSQSGGGGATATPTTPESQSGGEGDSGGRSSESGGQGGAAEGGGSASNETRSQQRQRRLRERRRRSRSRRSNRRGDFTGTNRTIYYEARSRCLAIPLRGLARSYEAASDSPEDVARAYAEREAPTGRAREAAIAGCLDGIDTRERRGF